MDELSESHLSEFTARLQPGQIATALFQALPDVLFWIKDSEGRFVYVNKTFCQDVAVMDAAEMVGLKDKDIFPAELAAVFQRGDEEVLSTHTAMWNKSELVPNRLGQVECRSTSKIPLKSIDGDWIGTAGISRKMGKIEKMMVPGRNHTLAIIVEAIYEYLEKPMSVGELAAAVSVSISTLERLFKTHMQTTPREFMLHVKMSAACDALMKTDRQIKEIAAGLGYEEHGNFTRAFTKTMGMSPRSYREFYKMG